MARLQVSPPGPQARPEAPAANARADLDGYWLPAEILIKRSFSARPVLYRMAPPRSLQTLTRPSEISTYSPGNFQGSLKLARADMLIRTAQIRKVPRERQE
jgi:hypothetical protein